MNDPRKGDQLDRLARSTLQSLARILQQAGLSAAAIREGLEVALSASAPPAERVASDADVTQAEAAHALTLWHQEPLYVGADGQPLALKLRGPAPSFEALVRRVSAKTDGVRILRYLRGTRAVKRRGHYYVATQRLVQLRGIFGPAALRNVRGLANVLRTYEHNLTPSEKQGWFERDCENAQFPVSKLEEFETLLHLEGMAFLARFDEFMQRCEAARDPDEPTLQLGVGVFRYQEED